MILNCPVCKFKFTKTACANYTYLMCNYNHHISITYNKQNTIEYLYISYLKFNLSWYIYSGCLYLNNKKVVYFSPFEFTGEINIDNIIKKADLILLFQ
jgi:hypothetical protein